MVDTKDYHWTILIPLIISIVGLAVGLSFLNVSVQTVLWFIFSAVLFVGGSVLRLLAYNVDKIVEELKQLRNQQKFPLIC